MESLRSYLNSLPVPEQEAYAERCGTSLGYLRKVISLKVRVREALAIALERESGGAVSVDETRPDVDWAYLRDRKSSLLTTRRRGGRC
jgi:DNA-binding transcriptional regulator YdaS (Cro superfamily)